MASESSSNSKNVGDSYIGNFISLISKYEIRYEGVLYYLNVQDSAIGLQNVRSYGTEGRKKDGPQVPPSDKVYEYILFRGSDIKDLQVKSPPSVQIDEQINNDPAIIQSQFAGVPLSPSPSVSVGGRTLTESTQRQDTPALASRVYPSALPTHQFSSQAYPSNYSLAAQNVDTPLFSTPLYWQGYNGTPLNVSQAQQNPIPVQSPSMLSSPLTVQSHVNDPDLNSSPIMGLINASEPVNPVLSSITSTSSHSSVTGSFTPVQGSMYPNLPSCSSIKASPSSQDAYTATRLSMSPFSSSFGDTNIPESQPIGKPLTSPAAADPLSVLSNPMPYPAWSSGSWLTSSPSLVTPGQLAQTRPHVLSSTQTTYPDHTIAVASLSSYTPSVNSTPVTQPPLLPLPAPAQQSLYSTTLYTEEFDFEAMNEKFKKDEVWGYLGKASQKDKAEGIEDDASGQSLGDKQGFGLLAKLDTQPAYKKDDFFDTISCNFHSRGARNAQNRFSERMKLDSETFGNFQQRSHVSYGPYGGYGAGHGQNYGGSYNWGRGYGYGGRGCGQNMYP
ncbi:protein decapping 5-like [Herrania umbratica]|uniref:Protein decapping 5-like n=1 Tax=Herrania umbratica TaxID=108875 RepID=A0A6J1AJ39_9ROSI|nr:protein decapping 5-like [Herrania umbratica]